MPIAFTTTLRLALTDNYIRISGDTDCLPIQYINDLDIVNGATLDSVIWFNKKTKTWSYSETSAFRIPHRILYLGY